MTAASKHGFVGCLLVGVSVQREIDFEVRQLRGLENVLTVQFLPLKRTCRGKLADNLDGLRELITEEFGRTLHLTLAPLSEGNFLLRLPDVYTVSPIAAPTLP